MGDAGLRYFGIRVRNFSRSVEFYPKGLDLVKLKWVARDRGACVLVKDRRSGQRLALNWHAPGSEFAVAYVPGEGLDHFGLRVGSVPETRERRRKLGFEPATRELPSEEEMGVLPNGHRLMNLKDPDGNFPELYDRPEESWDGPTPDHY